VQRPRRAKTVGEKRNDGQDCHRTEQDEKSARTPVISRNEGAREDQLDVGELESQRLDADMTPALVPSASLLLIQMV
jgi:hypothetical protein